MTQPARPDIDIEEAILDLIAHYPPLQADRHALHIDVFDGVVMLSGHVKSLISRRYLIDHAAQVSGVRSVNSDHLYTEENIRLESGRIIPSGVISNPYYGTVVLTGTLPEGTNAENVLESVSRIPGVERVVAQF